METRYRGCCCCFLNRHSFLPPSRRHVVDYRCRIASPSSSVVAGRCWDGRITLVSIVSLFSVMNRIAFPSPPVSSPQLVTGVRRCRLEATQH
ncbi:unnamed protein product [Lactuca virosa]|uniref:Uncharacterized protein n=1 Tax=Lactuca virosa TaxID=75947 RepID=A0AAU9MWD0_9ASTR|nr:unnamed protein product [Lactuca virosa]